MQISKLLPLIVLGFLETVLAEAQNPRPTPSKTARFFLTPTDSGPRIHADSLCFQDSLVRFRGLPERISSTLPLSGVLAIQRDGAEETDRVAAAAGIAAALAMGLAYMIDPTGDSPNEAVRGYRTVYYLSAAPVIIPVAYWVGKALARPRLHRILHDAKAPEASGPFRSQWACSETAPGLAPQGGTARSPVTPAPAAGPVGGPTLSSFPAAAAPKPPSRADTAWKQDFRRNQVTLHTGVGAGLRESFRVSYLRHVSPSKGSSSSFGIHFAAVEDEDYGVFSTSPTTFEEYNTMGFSLGSRLHARRTRTSGIVFLPALYVRLDFLLYTSLDSEFSIDPALGMEIPLGTRLSLGAEVLGFEDFTRPAVRGGLALAF